METQKFQDGDTDVGSNSGISDDNRHIISEELDSCSKFFIFQDVHFFRYIP